jgi:hypothetical protein
MKSVLIPYLSRNDNGSGAGNPKFLARMRRVIYPGDGVGTRPKKSPAGEGGVLDMFSYLLRLE